MSGDMNTALGNCIIMSVMVASYFHQRCPGIKWDMLDDGDDCLVFVEEGDYPRATRHLISEFLDYGMELTVEPPARKFTDIEFCRGRPVYDGHRWRFVLDPVRVLSNAATGKVLGHETKARLSSIGRCELILNAGIPVLQEWALALMRAGEPPAKVAAFGRRAKAHQVKGRTWKPLDRSDSYYWRLKAENRSLDDAAELPITGEARRSFAAAWGVSIERQLEWESYLKNLVVHTTFERMPDFSRDWRHERTLDETPDLG